MLNKTLFFLLKSILSWWELPSRWVPFVLLFTRTSDPSETRIMCKLMGKGGIKSTWILPNCRQQTNVGGLSFQTNKQTNQETKSLLPQVKKKKEKKVLNLASYQYQSWLTRVTRWVFSILGVSSLMQHMQMEALSMNPLCTSGTSACSHWPCCYSCIGNSDGHQNI